jgi:hypothetical protein
VSSPVQAHMLRLISENFQVLGSVVIPDAVDVVNDLGRGERSAECLFGYQQMLSHVAVRLRSGMVWHVDQSVTVISMDAIGAQGAPDARARSVVAGPRAELAAAPRDLSRSCSERGIALLAQPIDLERSEGPGTLLGATDGLRVRHLRDVLDALNTAVMADIHAGSRSVTLSRHRALQSLGVRPRPVTSRSGLRRVKYTSFLRVGAS